MTNSFFSAKIIKLKKLFREKYYKAKQKIMPRGVMSKYGILFSKNFSDSTFRFYLKGAYGFFYSKFLSGIHKPFIFIDIGANQGLYTILAAKNINCIASYAFEPVDSIFRLLVENSELNSVDDKCHLYNLGIGKSDLKIVDIFYDRCHTGISNLRDENSIVGTAKKIVLVDRKFLDLMDDFDGVCIHAKIDVEGLEEHVMSQLMGTSFSQNIKTLFFEVDENWVDARELYALLEKHGFNSFKKIGNKKKHYDVLARR